MKSSRPFDETCEAAALYALGKLPSAEAGRFEQRLKSGCPFCLAEMEGNQLVLDQLALAVKPVQPPASLEARLLERIGKIAPRPAKRVDAPKIVRADEGRWKQIAPGVTIRLLHEDKTMLVRMDPGSSLPSHPHAHDEQCLVLEGTIDDAEGNTARAGDFVMMTKGSTHSSIATKSGALFLIAYT
jgi:quercetin dioxygenase-like cupin family protein